MLDEKKHLFFDLDKTIAPSRQPILPEMYALLDALPHDIVVVSGQSVDKICWQSNDLPAFTLGQNGNHATDVHNAELWMNPLLSPKQKAEIHAHIDMLLAHSEEIPPLEHTPIEDRGAQITFSPVGNTAPVELKQVYDPDRKKREQLLSDVPFDSEEIMLMIGGSTSFDYIHKKRHKGANVAKLIDMMEWNRDECIYFGDGLFPGGNDEVVIGVIDTVPVRDHEHTYQMLQGFLK